jgi:hypothetical protein
MALPPTEPYNPDRIFVMIYELDGERFARTHASVISDFFKKPYNVAVIAERNIYFFPPQRLLTRGEEPLSSVERRQFERLALFKR